MDAWMLELIVVRERALDSERRSLARDCARGLLLRVRPGVYVERSAFERLRPEEQHVVAIRACAAVAAAPPVFSHWSAAVLHGLPFLGVHLDRVHVTVEDAASRGLVGVAGHVAPLDRGITVIGGLRVTDAARTVVDVARVSPFDAGVVVADGALHAGLEAESLHGAVADAAGRKGVVRAQQAVAFARAEAESAAESRSRCTMMRLGIEPPILQLAVHDRQGLAGRADFGFRRGRIGGEVDGEKKYRDAALAPAGPAEAVIAEKWREDRLRRRLDGLARWGYRDSGSVTALGRILASVGVVPSSQRATLADYSTPFLRAAL